MFSGYSVGLGEVDSEEVSFRCRDPGWGPRLPPPASGGLSVTVTVTPGGRPVPTRAGGVRRAQGVGCVSRGEGRASEFRDGALEGRLRESDGLLCLPRPTPKKI